MANNEEKKCLLRLISLQWGLLFRLHYHRDRPTFLDCAILVIGPYFSLSKVILPVPDLGARSLNERIRA